MTADDAREAPDDRTTAAERIPIDPGIDATGDAPQQPDPPPSYRGRRGGYGQAHKTPFDTVRRRDMRVPHPRKWARTSSLHHVNCPICGVVCGSPDDGLKHLRHEHEASDTDTYEEWLADIAAELEEAQRLHSEQQQGRQPRAPSVFGPDAWRNRPGRRPVINWRAAWRQTGAIFAVKRPVNEPKQTEVETEDGD